MKVSVVIPLYNKERHIRRAVDSVLAQSYPDWELIVVDDGSTDNGVDVVRGITDSRVRLVQQQNAGVSAARNRGVQEAASELVAFLDADDEWLPRFLETVMHLRAGYPQAGLYATAYRLNNGQTSWRPEFKNCATTTQGGLLDDYFRIALGTPPVSASAVMIPKGVLNEIGGFPFGVLRGEDLQTWVRIALRYRVAWSPAEGAIYHLSADNRACKTQAAHRDVPGASEIEAFLRAGYHTISSPAKITEYLSFMRLSLAKHYCLAGEKRLASELLAKTRGTVLFARTRRKLGWMVWAPAAFLRTALKLKILSRTTQG